MRDSIFVIARPDTVTGYATFRSNDLARLETGGLYTRSGAQEATVDFWMAVPLQADTVHYNTAGRARLGQTFTNSIFIQFALDWSIPHKQTQIPDPVY